MTKLQTLMRRQNATYTLVAHRAGLQPRTVRMLATGETPYDNVSVGTVRRIAEALAVPVYDLLDDEPVYPGDESRSRAERLTAAIDSVMWPQAKVPYLSPVESERVDEISELTPDEFFTGMPPIDADRG